MYKACAAKTITHPLKKLPWLINDFLIIFQVELGDLYNIHFKKSKFILQ